MNDAMTWSTLFADCICTGSPYLRSHCSAWLTRFLAFDIMQVLCARTGANFAACNSLHMQHIMAESMQLCLHAGGAHGRRGGR